MASVQAHPSGWAFLLKGRNMSDGTFIAIIFFAVLYYVVRWKREVDEAAAAKKWREDEEDRIWHKRREREWQWEEELRRRRKNRR